MPTKIQLVIVKIVIHVPKGLALSRSPTIKCRGFANASIAISTSLVVSLLLPPCRQPRLFQTAELFVAMKTLNVASMEFVEEEHLLSAMRRIHCTVCLLIARLMTDFACLRHLMVFVAIP